LYNYLSKNERALLPELLLNDGHISAIAKNYYNDESFCRKSNGEINLWNMSIYSQGKIKAFILILSMIEE
jgi:hypothetical protein